MLGSAIFMPLISTNWNESISCEKDKACQRRQERLESATYLVLLKLANDAVNSRGLAGSRYAVNVCKSLVSSCLLAKWNNTYTSTFLSARGSRLRATS